MNSYRYELVTNPIKIKDLLIFKYKDIFPVIEAEILKADEYNVNLSELTVNPIIYENEMDIDIIISYFMIINSYIKIFGDIFQNDIYSMRIHNIISDQQYKYILGNNIFERIFYEINNNLDIYLFDIYVVEETLTYYSDVSLDSFITIMDSYNDSIIKHLKSFVNVNILNKMNIERLSKNFNDLYDALFNEFSDIYLPFY